MKNINNFISEKLVIDKDIKMSSTGKDYWACKNISKPEMLKYVKKALKETKIKPEKIQEEISGYEDIDDLQQAYENEELPSYLIFEQKLIDMLDEDDNYMNCSGAIGTYVWIHAYDIFEEIINKGE
jgi:hypothetical protein